MSENKHWVSGSRNGRFKLKLLNCGCSTSQFLNFLMVCYYVSMYELY